MGGTTQARLARQAALFDEDRTYKGEPCKRGHTGTRYTSNRVCVQCTQDNARAYMARNGEKERKRKRKYAKARRRAERKARLKSGQ